MLGVSRHKWEVYVGNSQDEVVRAFQRVFKSEGLSYECQKQPPNIIYDTKKEQIVLNLPKGLEFRFIQVTTDPIHRFFSSFISPSSLQHSITLLSIKYTPEMKPTVKKILHRFVQLSANDPWKIRDHPRFRFAILLELLNKKKWKAFATK